MFALPLALTTKRSLPISTNEQRLEALAALVNAACIEAEGANAVEATVCAI